MTVQTTESAALVPAQVPTQIGSSVARYAEEIAQCMALAEQVVDTPIVPASYWPSVAIVVGGEAKILKSWEWDPRRKHPKESGEDYDYRRRTAIATTGGVVHVGITLGHESYYQSISGIYFVGGRPALMSEEMRSAVLRAGHYFRVIERGDERATVEVLRRGERGEPRPYTFTMADAERAGYVPGKGPNVGTDKWGKPKKGGNEKYLTDPCTMLLARATTVACKVEFPDVIRGLAPDERLDEPVDVTATATVTQVSAEDIAKPPVRTGALAALPTRTLEQPPAAGDIPAKENPADVTSESDGITDAQLRKLGAVMGDLGVTGSGSRERRLAIASHVVGRDLASSKDLTKAEGRSLIDTLEANGADIIAGLTPEADPVEVAQQHAATVEQQIAAARADADARAAQYDDEQAQAEQVDPTVEGGWPA